MRCSAVFVCACFSWKGFFGFFVCHRCASGHIPYGQTCFRAIKTLISLRPRKNNIAAEAMPWVSSASHFRKYFQPEFVLQSAENKTVCDFMEFGEKRPAPLTCFVSEAGMSAKKLPRRTCARSTRESPSALLHRSPPDHPAACFKILPSVPPGRPLHRLFNHRSLTCGSPLSPQGREMEHLKGNG